MQEPKEVLFCPLLEVELLLVRYQLRKLRAEDEARRCAPCGPKNHAFARVPVERGVDLDCVEEFGVVCELLLLPVRVEGTFPLLVRPSRGPQVDFQVEGAKSARLDKPGSGSL